MLQGISALMFVSYLAIGATLVLALTALMARRWKVGLVRLSLVALGLLLSLLAMGLLDVVYATSMVDGSGPAPSQMVDDSGPAPSQKATFGGEAISTQMNCAALGLVVGLVVGVVLEWRSRRRKLAG
jgi:hypothetical protein